MKGFLLGIAILLAAPALVLATEAGQRAELPASLAIRERLEQRIVKIYGQGGFRSLEGYQTGIIVDAKGHVATTNSLALNAGEVTVVFHNGLRSSANVVGADSLRDTALLKLEQLPELMHFDLNGSQNGTSTFGETAFVVSNLFNIAAGNEPLSIQETYLAGEVPLAPREPWAQVLDGQTVLLLDSVTSNPGAQGGAVVDRQGRLLGLVGRELRSRLTGAWQNYAIPTASLQKSIDRILSGTADQQGSPGTQASADRRINTLQRWGFALVPSIVPRTPPYIDLVRSESAADKAGLQADDLVLMVNGYVTASTTQVRRQLLRTTDIVSGETSNESTILLTVQRDTSIVELTLPIKAAPKEEEK